MLYKKEKMEEWLRQSAAEFLKKESWPQSLITVTGVNFDKAKNRASISVSIFPKEKGTETLAFIVGRKKDFIDYLKNHSRMRILPFVTFAAETLKIDGEILNQ